MVEWIYNKKIDLTDYYGFIYKITLPDGRYYIGQKSLWSKKKRKVGKRELESKGKSNFRKYRNKKREWVYYEEVNGESNWRDYIGSSKSDVIPDFISRHGKDKIKREILVLCKNKTDLTFNEARLLFEYDTMFDEKCINGNIMGNFFKDKVTKGHLAQ